MDELDRKLLRIIQMEFPLKERPFLEISKAIGISEDETILRVRNLIKKGVIRRIGPILDTERLGMVSTLVGMKIPEEEIEKAAEIVNAYDEISHNYLRGGGEYNMWFTISAINKERLEEILKEIGEKLPYPMLDLPTEKVFKIGVEFRI
ncbi:MAG: siroheme decarboxylase subunit alpha [Candidatus Syntropharchaeia archaeon]